MKCTVVTNNPKSERLKGIQLLWVDGNAVAVLKQARALLLEGGQLVLDPMAGHLARPNPFLTIAVEPCPQGGYSGEDILRLEYLVNMYKYKCPHVLDSQSFSTRLLEDYAELDFSLAASGLKE